MAGALVNLRNDRAASTSSGPACYTCNHRETAVTARDLWFLMRGSHTFADARASSYNRRSNGEPSRSGLSSDAVSHLQRSIGNAATRRLLVALSRRHAPIPIQRMKLTGEIDGSPVEIETDGIQPDQISPAIM